MREEMFNLTFVGLQRVFKMASRTNVDNYEINTLVFLYNQCNEEEQKHLIKRFGDKLPFLKWIK